MLLQPEAVPYRESFPVIVEVREHLDALSPRRDPLLPFGQLRFGVVPAPTARPPVKADEGPVRRQLVRLKWTRRSVADHESGVVLAEQGIDLGHEPAFMTELEAVSSGRQLGQRRAQPLVVSVEVAGQLPQHRADLRRADERTDALVEPLQSRPQIRQPLEVRQVPARLHREQEIRRALDDPPLDRRDARKPIEGRVDLDAVEQGRVVSEPPAGGQLSRVDALPPMRIVPARAADADRLHATRASISWRQRSGVAAATTLDRPTVSRGASPNGAASGRSIERPHSRISSWAAAMSTARAGLSEHTASTRPAARWQSDSASEPMTRMRSASPRNASTRSAMRVVSVASNERISISSFGPTPPSSCPFSHAPRPRSAVHSSPLPKS